MSYGKHGPEMNRVRWSQLGGLRMIRRKSALLVTFVLSLTIASTLTVVSPAVASPSCPGSSGSNRVVTISNPMAIRGGMVPGTYQVFSDPCVAQARATGLGNIANNQNYCVAVGTAATGAGGVAAITSAIAGTSATAAAAGIFAPLVGIAGVFAIGACLSTQASLNSMASHIRGAAQACGSLGIVYTFRSNLGPNNVNAFSSLTDIKCQNASGGVGNAPPAVAGLDWKSSNSKKLTWGEAPKPANPAKSLGHENVCSGGVATGSTHYVDVPSATAGADWVYLSRKLLSRASNASSATYTVATWNKNTGAYEAAKTVQYNCYNPDTPSTASACVLNLDVYYTPNGDRTLFKYLRHEGTSVVRLEHRWSHVTGLYERKGEFPVYCPTNKLVFTTAGTVSVYRPQNALYTGRNDTNPLTPVTFTIPNLPFDSTLSLSGAAAPYRQLPETGCTETQSGSPEIRRVTVYSSHPGYPKTFNLPGMRMGSETTSAGLPGFVEHPAEFCVTTITWKYQLSWKLTQS